MALRERCRTCRFWKLDLAPNETDPGEDFEPGFGWCPREPPKIIDHLARMAIQVPAFGGHNIDRDDVAPCSRVEDASLFPATFGQSWCGRYEATDDGLC